MKETLRKRWQSSVNCLTNELLHDAPLDEATAHALSSLSNKWMDSITSLYNEPHRAYHNMDHVEDVLASLDVLLGEQNNDDSGKTITTLAAFFHDVIYNPKSPTNEKDSAALFVEFASELSNVIQSSLREKEDDNTKRSVGNDHEKVPSSTKTASTLQQSNLVSQVEQCIIATATHISSANQARQSNNTLLAVFLDADMSILGRDANVYDRYAGCIRNEYEFVERSIYCEKRAEILESFLPVIEKDATEIKTTSAAEAASESSRDEKQHLFIYATDKGRELWECQARTNLKREIDMLRRIIYLRDE